VRPDPQGLSPVVGRCRQGKHRAGLPPAKEGRWGLGLLLPSPAHADVCRPPGAARPKYSPPDHRTVSPHRPPGTGHLCRKAESHPSLGAPFRVWQDSGPPTRDSELGNPSDSHDSALGDPAYHCDPFRPRSSEPPDENRTYGRGMHRAPKCGIMRLGSRRPCVSSFLPILSAGPLHRGEKFFPRMGKTCLRKAVGMARGSGPPTHNSALGNPSQKR